MSSLVLEQYGITLKRVEHQDIELIRQWRNNPKIRNTMAYKKKISTLQQEEWFKSINNSLNYYFLIYSKNSPVGVINCKDTDLKKQYGEGGIFIWDDNVIGTPIPLIASVILLDYIFNCIKIGNLSFVRILKDNVPAQRYNEFIGYIKAPGQNENKHQIYVLTRDTFNQKIQKLRKAASIFSENHSPLIVSGKICDLNLDEVNSSIGKSFTF
ncbi:MAG: GNAT family N-acetyltransferase [Flavobacteriales bacterium]|nr:GNAT family N-acetyltransferase [Flavobacteriales bacterium]